MSDLKCFFFLVLAESIWLQAIEYCKQLSIVGQALTAKIEQDLLGFFFFF